MNKDKAEQYFRDNYESISGKKSEEHSMDYVLGYLDCYKEHNVVDAPHWIPVKFREISEEDREFYPNATFMWDCQIPEEDEEVIIRTVWGSTTITTFEYYDDGFYFADYAPEDVKAWMRYPVEA